ncbi:hypothetical protein O0I10_011883 [Lichtheimia ornata]|uniref:Reverse transcriptase domain-containing protein n=1 Tax=Lichtheimia ornata TaxID=688661 RepID=A0AAD7UU23_9FUNG|nr:uncharacterized protein O0I10_011883 [Lichtheimia ornata]KAJ8652485.1 hypothetical protein O0I10_011883 [Lichtheimia ornata]
MVIQDQLSLDSNHKITHLQFDMPSNPPPLTTPTPRRQWHLHRLSESQPRQQYIDQFENNTRELTHILTNAISDSQTNPSIESLATSLNQAIYDALDTTIGAKPSSTPKSRTKWFWTEEIHKAMAHREHCYRKWRKAKGMNKVTWWIKHQEARAKVRLTVNTRRRHTWQQFCNNVANGEFTKALAIISKIKRNRTLSPTFADPAGPEAAAKRMANHLQSVYSGMHMHTHTPDLEHVLPPTHVSINHNDSPNSFDDSPFTQDQIERAIKILPTNKAPGVDHIKSEMLKPITHSLTPILLALFTLCWRNAQVPSYWRIAQVVPIHKKGSPDDPANFRPISLTSVFRKLLERCLLPDLTTMGPPLDIVQGGFRTQRSALDQARCLHEINLLHRKQNGSPPVLVFLDIKSAYDTVDRRIIWQALSSFIPPTFLALLKNMFDDVFIEVLISNHTSHRFQPSTGVLQGSVLSPLLYSHYINSLPTLLRVADNGNPSADPPAHVSIDGQKINSLLYADDVVILGTWESIPKLLATCEQHSTTLGYRWNPSKCVVLSETEPPPDQAELQLYGTPIPRDETFSYLGVPFKKNGTIDTSLLIHTRTQAALSSMRILHAIGLRPSGFSRLLACRLYRQFIRPKMEYGLAIHTIPRKLSTVLEQAQSNCLRMIYGGSASASTQVMCHLANLPRMEDRITILQAKFLIRAHNLPDDSLLHNLQPIIRNRKTRTGSWRSLLSTNTIWKDLLPKPAANTDRKQLKQTLRQFLTQRLSVYRSRRRSILLTACRPNLGVDPIMWIPMSKMERSRCVRWRLGWLPGGKPTGCPYCNTNNRTTRAHLTQCLQVHQQLAVPSNIKDPISWLLNQLPTSKPKSSERCQYWIKQWPLLCTLLQQMDNIQHNTIQQHDNTQQSHGQSLIQWLEKDTSTGDHHGSQTSATS